MEAEVIVKPFPDTDVIQARALVLKEPLSFWGGVSATDGRLLDRQFEGRDRFVSGQALFIQELRGSSSASSVLLELIYRRLAPAVIVLDSPDAILALGVIVGREMGWPSPPILRMPASKQASIADGSLVKWSRHGELIVCAGEV
jgi:predicted aconitase with swiveling domain